jgi:N-acetylmuramoyl-L-alanine amidase
MLPRTWILGLRGGLLLVALVLVLPGSGGAQVESIGIAGDGQYTRITITSPQQLESDVVLTAEDEQLGLEWLSPALNVRADAYLAVPAGGVVAYTLLEDRIRFEIDRPMMVARLLEVPAPQPEGPWRYVIDLSEVSLVRFTRQSQLDSRRLARLGRAAKPEGPAATTAQIATSPSLKPAALSAGIADVTTPRKYVIVVDPGHGGRDPGALSVIGGQEKDIVLKAAKALATELSKNAQYEVHLTRDDDRYIEHEDRVTLARNWGADLFISLHADAAGAASVQGASVYTISTRGESRIDGAADKYGWEIPIETGTSETVSGILQDLVRRETKSNSAIFAELLLPELARAGPLVRNSHRQGNLFVLLAPDVPAVLIEIGFLTNRQDARRLSSGGGRRRAATAIKRAIDAYFDQQELRLASN